MIRRIELVNFMSHARTVIEPADGLTVLVGPNNCGKSAVVTALQILCHNDTSTYVMRHGERECSVTIETSEGDAVQWRRRKSPAYFVNGTELSRLERSEVPDEVVRALRLAKVASEPREFDIHFGEQKSPVFLLNKSGPDAAKFFASSSDAAKLVEMQQRHQRKMSDAKRERTRLAGEAEQLARDLAILSAADPIGVAIQEAEAQYAAIERSSSDIAGLTNELHVLSGMLNRWMRVDSEAAVLAPVRPPPMLEPTELLERLLDQLTKTTNEHNCQTMLADVLAVTRPAPELIDERPLACLTEDLHGAKRLWTRLAAEYEAMHDLRSPPLLADTGSLQALVWEIGATDRQFSGVQARAVVLGELKAPPEMADARTLDTTLREIVEVSRRVEGLQARTTFLTELSDPPKIANESELVGDLQRLRDGDAALNRAKVTCDRLSRLMPPVEQVDVAEIDQLISTLREADMAVSRHGQHVTEIEHQCRDLESRLRRWAEEHEVCPTCGGVLDPDRVTEHARSHAGGAHV